MIRNHSRHGSRFPITLGGGAGYSVNKSLRFRSSASAYLNRTPAVAGNQSTWTWSGWVKRGRLAANQEIFGITNGTTDSVYLALFFASDDTLWFSGWNTAYRTTTQVFRDPSAWYHIAVALDTTQATAADRVKLYINGTAVASFVNNVNPAQNASLIINSTVGHFIGRDTATVGGIYLDGELAEVNFVDGYPTGITQALWASTNIASSFGAFSTYNQWLPIRYAGTYGTNGFYLPFTNTTSTSTLVADSSGNANNWTPNNISLTAGSTYDSLTDVPTLTSTTVANYAVLNPLAPAGGTFSNGNLQYVGPSDWRTVPATLAMNGSYYAEATLLANALSHVATSAYAAFGVAPISISVTGNPPLVNALLVYDAGFVYNQTSQVADLGAIFVAGDIIGIAFVSSTGAFTVYKNNVSVSTGTLSATGPFTFTYTSYSSAYGQMAMNFGQRPFTYTPPTGFLPLNTFNIAAGTVTTSGTFTGNASTDGPMVWLNGTPTAMAINGNAVTFGTQADKLANGFKVRSSSASYNASGSNTYTASTVGAVFKYEDAQGNP